MLLLLLFIFLILALIKSWFLCAGWISTILCGYLILQLNDKLILVWLIALTIWLVYSLYYLIFKVSRLIRKLSLLLKSLIVYCGIAILIGIPLIVANLFSVNVPLWLNLTSIIAIFLLTSLTSYYFSLFWHGILTRKSQQLKTIVILGAGLTHQSHISPELQHRLTLGLKIYQTQKQAPTIIMSGGQGPDETVSEAAAMKEYALKQGIDSHYILTESQSRNTWENLANAQRIIRQQHLKMPVAVISNNYHTLRILAYARKQHLTITAVGSQSNWRFFPTASIREWIGLLSFYRYTNLLILIAMFLELIVINLIG